MYAIKIKMIVDATVQICPGSTLKPRKSCALYVSSLSRKSSTMSTESFALSSSFSASSSPNSSQYVLQQFTTVLRALFLIINLLCQPGQTSSDSSYKRSLSVLSLAMKSRISLNCTTWFPVSSFMKAIGTSTKPKGTLKKKRRKNMKNHSSGRKLSKKWM